MRSVHHGTSVMRFAHTGRSSFLLKKEGGWWCRCYKGKSKAENGKRKGFVWFAPNVTLTQAQVTPLQILYNMWVEASSAFLFSIRVPQGNTSTVHTLPGHPERSTGPMAPSVHISQSKMIVTYSVRRVGATLTSILELDLNNEYALGCWTAPGASREANDIRRGMPTVYTGLRATMEEMAKTALWATAIILLAETAASTQSPTWEDVHMVASRVAPEGRHANMVYFKELHKATILTKVSPTEVAYGVDHIAAIENIFTVTRGMKSEFATPASKPLKMEPPHEGSQRTIRKYPHHQPIYDGPGARQNAAGRR